MKRELKTCYATIFVYESYTLFWVPSNLIQKIKQIQLIAALHWYIKYIYLQIKPQFSQTGKIKQLKQPCNDHYFLQLFEQRCQNYSITANSIKMYPRWELAFKTEKKKTILRNNGKKTFQKWFLWTKSLILSVASIQSDKSFTEKTH